MSSLVVSEALCKWTVPKSVVLDEQVIRLIGTSKADRRVLEYEKKHTTFVSDSGSSRRCTRQETYNAPRSLAGGAAVNAHRGRMVRSGEHRGERPDGGAGKLGRRKG